MRTVGQQRASEPQTPADRALSAALDQAMADAELVPDYGDLAQALAFVVADIDANDGFVGDETGAHARALLERIPGYRQGVRHAG